MSAENVGWFTGLYVALAGNEQPASLFDCLWCHSEREMAYKIITSPSGESSFRSFLARRVQPVCVCVCVSIEVKFFSPLQVREALRAF